MEFVKREGMAVFMLNICKFNSCGLTFPNLADLIQHIEDTHIDYDPHNIEQKELQQPSCLPLSYVLRFFTDATRKEGLETKRKLVYKTSTALSHTPTGSEADEDESVMSESEDSNDSWTTPEEFSAEFILRYGSSSMHGKKTPVYNPKKPQQLWVLNPASNNSSNNNNLEKPFACPVPGCKKRYKNVNGIKYHSKNGHKKDGKVRKGFKCHCGKSYKTGQGLKNHTTALHNGVNLATLTTQNGEIIQIPTSRVASLQPLRAVTLKQISAASFSTLGLKAIQGIVVATKQSEPSSKADGTVYEKLTFSKSSNIQMAVPSIVNSSKGLLNGIVASKAIPEQTVTSTLGVLTPATSPQTFPQDVTAIKTPSSVPLNLPNSSALLHPAGIKAVDIDPRTVVTHPTLVHAHTNQLGFAGNVLQEVSSTTQTHTTRPSLTFIP